MTAPVPYGRGIWNGCRSGNTFLIGGVLKGKITFRHAGYTRLEILEELIAGDFAYGAI